MRALYALLLRHEAGVRAALWHEEAGHIAAIADAHHYERQRALHHGSIEHGAWDGLVGGEIPAAPPSPRDALVVELE
jgi:hypothetical protein